MSDNTRTIRTTTTLCFVAEHNKKLCFTSCFVNDWTQTELQPHSKWAPYGCRIQILFLLLLFDFLYAFRRFHEPCALGFSTKHIASHTQFFSLSLSRARALFLRFDCSLSPLLSFTCVMLLRRRRRRRWQQQHQHHHQKQQQ